MGKLINVSIDVMKFDKTRFVQGKNGAKYANITVELKDEKDQYDNDASCWEAQTKEERDAKTPRTYLGNGRVIWSSEPAAQGAQPAKGAPATAAKANTSSDDSELPF